MSKYLLQKNKAALDKQDTFLAIKHLKYRISYSEDVQFRDKVTSRKHPKYHKKIKHRDIRQSVLRSIGKTFYTGNVFNTATS